MKKTNYIASHIPSIEDLTSEQSSNDTSTASMEFGGGDGGGDGGVFGGRVGGEFVGTFGGVFGGVFGGETKCDISSFGKASFGSLPLEDFGASSFGNALAPSTFGSLSSITSAFGKAPHMDDTSSCISSSGISYLPSSRDTMGINTQTRRVQKRKECNFNSDIIQKEKMQCLNTYVNTKYTDLCFNVVCDGYKTTKFHVTKNQMCSMSDVWEGCIQCGLNELEINENPKDFNLLLNTFVPFFRDKVTDANYLQILKLSFKYNVILICIKFILDSKIIMDEKTLDGIWYILKTNNTLSSELLDRRINCKKLVNYEIIKDNDFKKNLLVAVDVYRSSTL